MTSRKLRFGYLSTAGIGKKMRRAMLLSSNCEVAAVASRSLERAQAWARQENIPLAFGSYEEMLASDKIDAVYIAVPNAFHKEWAVRTAQHGKHILCEKPIAISAAEVEEMIEAAEKNGVRLMEGFMYRFHPQYQLLGDLINLEKAGPWKVIRSTLGFYLDDHKRPNDIRWVKELGGGALYDVGSYCVNALQWMAFKKPTAVIANAIWSPTGVDETFSGQIEFSDGIIGIFDCGFRMEYCQRLEISGVHGYFRLDQPFAISEEETEIIYENAGKSKVYYAPAANEFSQMVEHFANAVLNGLPLAYPPTDSLNQMYLIDALYQSARSGCRVKL